MPVPHVALAVLCGTTGGPATYGRRLARALAATGELRLTVLTDRPEHFDAPGIDTIALPMHGGLDRLRWQYLRLPRALRRVRPDVFHDSKNALPPRLVCPSVVTVHDLAYHTVKDSFGFWSRQFLVRATRDAVRRAATIVVPSTATRRDLERIHPRVAGRVHVVPHGIDPAPPLGDEQVARRLAELAIPRPYVLHVGTVQARKNVDLVVAGTRLLRARGLPHKVLVVGRRGWLAERAVREIERDDTAVWHRHLSRDDLAIAYRGASAFVSPSAYEGFGLAVADALAAGVPTVIADVGSLPELCGDAAVRLPALSAEAVAAALHAIFTDDDERARLAAAGRTRAAGFSWRTSAEGHLRAYRAALG